MSTLNNTVKDWLQNALLQLGAESYLYGALDITNASDRTDAIVRRLKFGFNDPTHSYIVGIAGTNSDTPKLPAHNRMIVKRNGVRLG